MVIAKAVREGVAAAVRCRIITVIMWIHSDHVDAELCGLTLRVHGSGSRVQLAVTVTHRAIAPWTFAIPATIKWLQMLCSGHCWLY